MKSAKKPIRYGEKLGFNPSCNPKSSGSSMLSGIIQNMKNRVILNKIKIKDFS